jgi:hypothetical protein
MQVRIDRHWWISLRRLARCRVFTQQISGQDVGRAKSVNAHRAIKYFGGNRVGFFC